MKKKWVKPAITILLGSLLFLILARVFHNRIQEAEARGAVQDKKVEIPVPVEVLTIEPATIRQWINGTGNARAVQREFLAFETDGRVNAIMQIEGRDIQEGDRVQGPRPGYPQGDVLAQLDDKNQLAALKVAQAGLNEALEQQKVAQATVEQARARFELASKQFEREEALLAAEATARETYEKAQTDLREAQAAADVAVAQLAAARTGVTAMQAKLDQAQIELEKTRIYCPIDGIIAYKNLKVGWYFSPQTVRTDSEEAVLGSIPFMVINPSQFEIVVEVPAFESAGINTGQAVEIKTVTSSTTSIAGRVQSVAPAINPGDRATRVRIRTAEGVSGLRDGDYVQCRLLVSQKEGVISIPFHATVMQDNRLAAFIVNAENRAERRSLVLGIQGDDQYEILDGLAMGDRVVTAGRFNLYDGALVEAVAFEESINLD